MAIQYIDYNKCNDCGICVTTCMMGVFRKFGKKIYIAYSEDCQTCFLCEIMCPVDAIYVNTERGKIGKEPIVLPY